MRIPKRYGQNKLANCPFCGAQSTALNTQKIPVCPKHTTNELLIKCACGSYLDAKQGKFGAFFLCTNCGPISMSKAMELYTAPNRQHL